MNFPVFAADIEASETASRRFSITFFWMVVILPYFAWANAECRFGALIGGLSLLCWIGPKPSRPKCTAPVLWGSFIILIISSCGAFLPYDIGRVSPWRTELIDLGVQIDRTLTPQPFVTLQSVIQWAIFIGLCICAFTRTTDSSLRRPLAAAFGASIALWSLLAHVISPQFPQTPASYEHFGFFGNRNHSGTLLTMGFLVSLGSFFQATRSSARSIAVISAISFIVISWAILTWSISRAPIVLCGAGFLLWFTMVGRGYWRSTQWKLLSIIAIGLLGVGALVASKSRERLLDTDIDRSVAIESTAEKDSEAINSLDFRVPVIRDTISLTKDHLFTGVGLEQFRWIYPQYRHHSISQSQKLALHPESSWLLVLSEQGLGALLALLALVGLIFFLTAREIREKRQGDRSLRAALWVAALIPALHSIADVPGHRPILIFVSIFLLCLARSSQVTDAPSKSRHLYGLSTLLGIALLSTNSTNALQTPSQQVEDELGTLEKLQNEVENIGAAKPLKTHALRLRLQDKLDAMIEASPMNPRLYFSSAANRVSVGGAVDDVKNDLSIQSILSPSDPILPIQQSALLAVVSKAEAEAKWREALRRARKVVAIAQSSQMDTRFYQRLLPGAVMARIRYQFRSSKRWSAIVDDFEERINDESTK